MRGLRIMVVTSILRKKANVERFILDIVGELSEKVEKIFVLVLQGEELKVQQNVVVKICPVKSPFLRIAWLIVTILRLTVTEKIDVYICFVSEILAIVLSACSYLTRKKTFYWYCSVYPRKNLKQILALRVASYILTCSDLVKQYYKISFGIEDKKIFNVGHGIAIDRFTKERTIERLSYKQSSYTILSVGRISPIKQWEKLVLALAEIKKSYPNIKLIVIGDPPKFTNTLKYYEHLKHMINELSVQTNWIFLGSQPNENLPHYYAEADVCVFTGYAYKTILEALAVGVPTIFERKAGLLIFPKDEDWAMRILSFENHEELVQCLIKAINKTPDIIKATARLSEFVRSYFSTTAYVERLLKCVTSASGTVN